MKGILSHLTCPGCGKAFPLFGGFSQRIRRGFLLAPAVKCNSCGMISRGRLSLQKVLYAWPLTFLLLLLVICIFRNAGILVSLRHNYSAIYGLIGGAIMGLILGIGLNQGYILVPLFDEHGAKSSQRKFITSLAVVLCVLLSLLLGYITGRWVSILLMLAVGLAVCALFYSQFAKMEEKNNSIRR
jgi:hypothetical protein